MKGCRHTRSPTSSSTGTVATISFYYQRLYIQIFASLSLNLYLPLTLVLLGYFEVYVVWRATVCVGNPASPSLVHIQLVEVITVHVVHKQYTLLTRYFCHSYSKNDFNSASFGCYKLKSAHICYTNFFSKFCSLEAMSSLVVFVFCQQWLIHLRWTLFETANIYIPWSDVIMILRQDSSPAAFIPSIKSLSCLSTYSRASVT